jgi:sigma-B regulation protein RsbU (phosphoserine phosphatase)
MAMLPRSFPTRPEIEVAAALLPARSVGGDPYDVVDDGGSVGFLIGDVSGKGVGAALFMAVTKTLFRAVVSGATSVADVVTRMNGDLEYVNARHNPTCRLGANGACAALGGDVAPALGAVEDHPYGSTRLRLDSCLGGCGSMPAAGLVRGIVERLVEFTADVPQYDDVTVLALRYRGPA